LSTVAEAGFFDAFDAGFVLDAGLTLDAGFFVAGVAFGFGFTPFAPATAWQRSAVSLYNELCPGVQSPYLLSWCFLCRGFLCGGCLGFGGRLRGRLLGSSFLRGLCFTGGSGTSGSLSKVLINDKTRGPNEY
jgi:apolipoprotein N-acyltransferase